MYRYSVDNAVTYTSEDFVLFRESPFACWMERLTLENPDHGIPPDVGSQPPANTIERQDDIADTLRAEERDVALIDWDANEPERRSATLDAMRRGVDFVVNGQLALGPLSGAANLLMRTSGYSELGNYLYIPCDTQSRTSPHSGFRLCFLADLLHSLQGQLPPQMLIIRGGADVMPIQSEDRIYHYRAVKQRFMEAMRTFRKHRMPDPAESAHFGRWSDCANEVLKQRALRLEAEQELGLEQEEVAHELPLQKVAGDRHEQALDDGGADAGQLPDAGGTLAEQARMITADTYQIEPREVRGVSARTTFTRGRRQTPPAARTRDRAPETVEPKAQAAMEAPGEAATVTRPTVEEPPRKQAATASAREGITRRSNADAALQNLAFIGSHEGAPLNGPSGWSQPDQRAYEVAMPAKMSRPVDEDGPELSLTELMGAEPDPALFDEQFEPPVQAQELDVEIPTPPAPAAPPPNLGSIPGADVEPLAPATAAPRKAHPLDSIGFDFNETSFVDRDDTHISQVEPDRVAPDRVAPDRVAPELTAPSPAISGYAFLPVDDEGHDTLQAPATDHRPFGSATDVREGPQEKKDDSETSLPFNSSLITNREYEE